MNPEIVRYLAENRARYTDAALRDALLRAGHSAGEVDEALGKVGPGGDQLPSAPAWSQNEPHTDRRSVARSPRFWPVSYTHLTLPTKRIV